ncbi:hypothetical protein OIDMADRAFT_172245 [Oidiodendron maius Zn]|uniref:Phytocyanin domain-containing protein n=1 Tax=Oidiodendron maius (strain Zn) TaxID=913774 RepID=A0A0C3C8A8_OIDMZ|nr:hypothetical protein OIDMADRAFT_172245 [Oidiodendron maius Zn]
MTLYGSSSLSNTNAFSVSASTMQAYAIPFEGYAGKAVAPISVPAATTSSSSAPAATYTVVAADAFTPNTVNAQTGDSILFQFKSGNHSLTQSTFNSPCEPLTGGTESGFMPNLNNQVPFPSYTLIVNTSDPQWFYSEGESDCASGMTFGLNPNSTETEAEFQGAAVAEASAAAAQNKSSGGASKGVKIGVSIGVIVFALVLALALGALFMHRRRQALAASPPYEVGAGIDHYAAEHKYYTQGEAKPPVPTKNYELADTRTNDMYSRHELASPPVELAGSRFSDHLRQETSSPPHQGSFYDST